MGLQKPGIVKQYFFSSPIWATWYNEAIVILHTFIYLFFFKLFYKKKPLNVGNGILK